MTEDAFIGTTLAGRYQVLELLGRGGMASVYKARQLLMNTTVAIKVLDGQIDPRLLERFRREAKVLSRLNHPAIVKFIGLESDGGTAFMVMEYVDGLTLRDYLQQNGPLSVEQFRSIFGQVADALAHAHDEGVVHRDIKTANVLIASDGAAAKVLDFGVARLLDISQKLTSTGGIIGTASYMSPEQCSGGAVDERSDVYSLGCVMHEALTGMPPFAGDSGWDTLLRQLNEPLPTIDDPNLQMLAGVISKATEKDPTLRYANMRALGEAVRTGELYQRRDAGQSGRRKQKNRNLRIPSLCAAVALVIIFLVTMTSGVLNHLKSTDHQPTESFTRRDALAILNQPAIHQGKIFVTGGQIEQLTEYADHTGDYPVVSAIFQKMGNNAKAYEYFRLALNNEKVNIAEMEQVANAVNEQSPLRAEIYWDDLYKRFPHSSYWMQLTKILADRGEWRRVRDTCTTVVDQVGAASELDPKLRSRQVKLAQKLCQEAKEHLNQRSD